MSRWNGNRLATRRAVTAQLLLGLGLAGGAGRLLREQTLSRSLQAWWLGARYLDRRDVELQQQSNDCGPAALHMILARYGLQSSTGELRALIQLGPRGATLSALGRAAGQFGLKAYGWKLYPDDLERVALPILAWLKRGHFVVVERLLDDGSLVVLDPAVGRLHYRSRSFWRQWRGEALLFSLPGGPGPLPRPRRSAMGYGLVLPSADSGAAEYRRICRRQYLDAE